MSPHDILLNYGLPPISLVFLLLVAVLVLRLRALSRWLFLTGTFLLLICSLPFVGDLLLRPLGAVAVPYNPLEDRDLSAVLVPTAGAFDDGTGTWWPSPATIMRGVAGRRVSRELGLPLIVSGGSTDPRQPPEARILARHLDLQGPGVTLETESGNSAETAAAVAELLVGSGNPRILLVTSPKHVARMALALRRQGIVSVIARPEQDERGDATRGPGLIPSYSGLKTTRAALYEYAGIAWYLMSGEIAIADLWPATP